MTETPEERSQTDKVSFPDTSELKNSAAAGERTQADLLSRAVAELGYVESPELASLASEYREALRSRSDDLPAVAGRYQDLAQQTVEEKLGEDYARAQIGLMLRLAQLRLEAGDVEAYRADLDDALEYAVNMGLDNLVLDLSAEPEQWDPRAGEVFEKSRELARVCAGVLSPEDCEDLLHLDFDEALGMAYSLLMEAGEDPEEYLKDKGILE